MIPQGKSLRFVLPALGAVAAFGLLLAAAAHSLLSAEGKSTATDAAAAARVERSYAKLPVSFEPNRGQTDPRVRFLARGSGYGLLLMKNEAVLSLRGKGSAATAVRMRALGANPDPEIVGERRLPGRVNYLRGRDPRGWQTGLPTYAAVRYRGLYPGIDQVFYGSQGRLEYDFVVAPAADPGRIGLTFSGAKALSLGRGGELLLEVAGGTLRQPRPFVYQKWDGKRRAVAARYVLDGDRVAFALGRYDRSRPLVIDPKIAYSTYLAGPGQTSGQAQTFGSAIAVDQDGSAYVAGRTLRYPSQGNTPFGGIDIFVTKLNESGSALEYSTYLGGRGDESVGDLAVDEHERAYLVGTTHSADFPTTAGAVQPVDPDSAGPDAFVTKLSREGAYLKYSTYLGGRGSDGAAGIAVDSDGRAYVSGTTASADFPTTPDAFQPSLRGGFDAFVTKLSLEGTDLKYSTYLGGSRSDSGTDIAVDTDERAYVTGTTYSADFPTTPGAFQPIDLNVDPSNAGADVYVTKLSREGTSLKYSTYLGGQGLDRPVGIAVDGEQRAYVTGYTDSTDFPTTPGAFQAVPPDHRWWALGFVTKLSREGTDLKYSTYLGDVEDYPTSIAVDKDGRAYVTGTAHSDDFPTTPDAFQPKPLPYSLCREDAHAFVTKLNTDGTALRYSTYLGGTFSASGLDVAVDVEGNFYVTGAAADNTEQHRPSNEQWSGCPDVQTFPTTSGAFQSAPSGVDGYDAFVTKFGD